MSSLSLAESLHGRPGWNKKRPGTSGPGLFLQYMLFRDSVLLDLLFLDHLILEARHHAGITARGLYRVFLDIAH